MSLMQMENLFAVPDHIRKTLLVMLKLGFASADLVSEHTGRARAVESSYLNQLAVMGLVEKNRLGRQVYFNISKMDKRWLEVSTRFLTLSQEYRQMLEDDIITAFQNRLKILEHVNTTTRLSSRV